MISRFVQSIYCNRRTILIKPNRFSTIALKVRRGNVCKRHYSNESQKPLKSENIIIQAVSAVRNNIPGYTKVLLVVVGMLTVVIVVAEASIANQTIILNVLPGAPNHGVYSYDDSIFDALRTAKQIINAETTIVNVYGAHGTGKTELLRQYSNDFIDKGPHLYYQANKLSNRRMCQVFFVDASCEETLRHSLSYLTAKLKQTKETVEDSEIQSSLSAIAKGLKNLSRWVIVFEDVSPKLDILKLIGEYQDWGDGQIILTSEKPIKHCKKHVPINSILPQNVYQDVYNLVSPSDNTVDITRLKSLCGSDLRNYLMFATCIKTEQENDIEFKFSDLFDILSNCVDPQASLIKFYSGILSLRSPQLICAIDFLARMPINQPVPYEYVKQHMNNCFYSNWYENMLVYAEYRKSHCAPLLEKQTIEEVGDTLNQQEPPIDPEDLSFIKRHHYKASVYLGLEPNRPWLDQFKELYEQLYPKPQPPSEDAELRILKDCLFIEYNPKYGGHVPTVKLKPNTQGSLRSFHSQITAPLLESAVVLEQERQYSRTWMSKFKNFDQASQTENVRKKVLGKNKVHPQKAEKEKQFECRDYALEHLLFYKTPSISSENISEYEELLQKQVLKSVMAFTDVTLADTVEGTIKTILMHHILEHLKMELPVSYASLANSCSLFMKSQLGFPNLEEDFKTTLEHAKRLNPKGPSHASALHRYAIWLYQNSRYEEAKVLLDEAITFADSIALNRSVALVSSELRIYDVAEKHLDKSLKMINAGDQEILVPLLVDLGQVLLLRGKTVLGIQCLQKAIDGFKNIVGKDTPEYARALNIVSIGHLMLGDVERSKRARSEAGSVLKRLKKNYLIGS